MSDNKTTLDRVAEGLNSVTKLLKEKFSQSVESFADVTLADGETVITYEGELGEGTAVFIKTDEEDVPAQEGTYALGGDMEGVSIVVDAEGKVTEVIDERETEEEAMSKEDVEGIVSEELSKLGLGEALQPLIEAVNSLVEEVKTGQETADEFKTELEDLKENFNKFKDAPEKGAEKKKFARNEKPEGPGAGRTQRFIKNRKAN